MKNEAEMLHSFLAFTVSWFTLNMHVQKEVPMKTTVRFGREDLPRIAAIFISALIYSIGMVVFVRSGNLFPGGYAGVSRLISLIAADRFGLNIPFSVVYFILNIATTLFIYKTIGHKFVLYSVLWYTLSSIMTGIIHLPVITQDPLLIAVFGGLVNGFAVGITLKSNGSTGGTDFIAIDLSQRLHRPTWNYIFAFNAIVLACAGYLYGWNQALYSIIFQYVSKEVVGMMHQRYKVSRLHVVTDKPDEICTGVFKICRHGITRIACQGAYSHQDHTLLMLSINTYQLRDVEKCILEIDPHAFISVNAVERIIGNYYQTPLE